MLQYLAQSHDHVGDEFSSILIFRHRERFCYEFLFSILTIFVFLYCLAV